MPNKPWPPWAAVAQLFRGEQRQSQSLTMSQVFRDPIPTFSGVTVTEETALNLSAVWAAVSMIAGSVASLPLHFYRRIPGGKEQYPDHPLYWLLHDEPNEEDGSYTFRELLTQHMLLWGNGYAEIQRNESQQAIGLWPIAPNRVAIDRPNPRGPLRYRVTNADGKDTYLRPDQMLHVRGLGFDGVKGYSVIHMARQSLGLTAATERFGAQFFGNGAHSSWVGQHPAKMSEAAQKRFKDSVKDAVGGHNQLSMLILEEGIKLEKVTIPPDDAQFLETRRYQTEEIARWFNIPPHKIKDLERSTNNNIEQQSIEYVQDTLEPPLKRWEQELNRKLVRPLEKGRQFFEHNVKGRLRGDIAAQTNHYAVMGSHGYYMIDEVRAFEGLNPLPDGLGQRCFIQGAMVPLDRIDEIITAQVKPKPEPDAAEVVDAEPASSNGDRAEIIAAIVTALRSTILEAIPAPPPQMDLTALGETLRAEVVKAFPLLPDPEPAPEPDAARHARIVASHRLVVSEAVRRMFRREKERARVAAKNAERMRAWVGDFYERHGESFRGELLPGIGAHCAYLGGDRDAAQVTGELVATWCDESKRQLHALLDRGPADLLAEVDALFTRWEGDRLHSIPDAIMQEELVGHG